MVEELKNPRLIETYVRTYNEERKRLASTAISTRTRIERKRDRLESERQRAIDMVIKGVICEDDARTRIAQLRAEVIQAEHELLSLEEVPRVVALHPATLDGYISTVDRLASVLTGHAEAADDRGPLVTSFRALVHSVTVHPKAPREGFEVEVKGKLAALIGGDAFPQAKYSGGRVVAEEGFEYIM
jgi:site-specific DNA recombinase